MVLDLPTPEGQNAELTQVDGYIPTLIACSQSPIQVVTGPDVEQLR